MEVLMTLFCWKILFPGLRVGVGAPRLQRLAYFALDVLNTLLRAGFVWLNRGNHEDRSQNQHYNRGRHGCWVRYA
jgi:hypothetical protein